MGVLDPPLDLKATKVTNSSITIEWTQELYGPLCPVLNYKISWQSSVEVDNVGSANADTAVTYTVDNLSACTLYNVEVRSNNTVGLSNQAITEAMTAFSNPGDLSNFKCALSTNGHNFDVSWMRPEKNNCIRGFNVSYMKDVLWTSEVEEIDLYTNKTNWTLENLTPWTEYTVCVIGDIGENIYGEYQCCNATTEEEPPGAPASLNKTSSGKRNIKLEWEKPLEENGILIGYQLTWGRKTRNFSDNDTSAIILKLEPKTTYNFTLQVTFQMALVWH
ncbi:hypothetical protein SK128_004335 [Halocaridina rubra]|uniref:Fibronectin type-III domain-containing protein n=1 Tax=Halocaridina rubra TaxID=373956 RepID=A0AAN9A2U0_HALRR